MAEKQNKSYSEDLRNPLWQKKRLQILDRDDFTCQICGHKDKPLHVHHFYYENGLKPWEYSDSDMITLCEECHKAEHKSRKNILDSIDQLRESGVTMLEIESVLQELSIRTYMREPDVALKMIGGPMKDDDQDYWGLDWPNAPCERIAKWREKVYGRLDKTKQGYCKPLGL